MFEFCDRPEDLEKHPTNGGTGIDALVEHQQIDAVSMQILRQRDEVFEGAAKSVQLGDHQMVASPGDELCPVELRATSKLAAGLVDEDLGAAGSRQRILLGLGVLVPSAHSPIPLFTSLWEESASRVLAGGYRWGASTTLAIDAVTGSIDQGLGCATGPL